VVVPGRMSSLGSKSLQVGEEVLLELVSVGDLIGSACEESKFNRSCYEKNSESLETFGDFHKLYIGGRQKRLGDN
jgi:hypothetical protein